MWIADQWRDYELLDCGNGEKLERWDTQYLVRPDPQAIWATPRRNPAWKRANARYLRSQSGGGHWEKKALPESWKIRYRDLTFQVKPMNFKHTGLFPEQAVNWDFAMEKIRSAGRPIRVLNLFAYTGGATVACAKAGASVCHVDAARGMVAWARENARLSGLGEAPIRWIVDDCAKFVEREIRRRVDDALAAVGMSEFVRHAPHLLSGGQKQRIAIAGVLAMEPACIVLDEATAMLDPVGRREVLSAVHRLNREKGITVVLITHHMNEAEDADRVVVMDDGKVALDGTPREVFTQVDALRSMGLTVPDTVDLLDRLRKDGLDVPLTALTVEACADAIYSAVAK